MASGTDHTEAERPSPEHATEQVVERDAPVAPGEPAPETITTPDLHPEPPVHVTETESPGRLPAASPESTHVDAADVAGPPRGAQTWRGWLAPVGRMLPPWLTPGVFGLGVYLVALAWFCVTQGVPIDRVGQAVWIIAGILAAGLGRTWRQHLRVFTDWIPLLAALILYDHTRGIADSIGATVRVEELVNVETWLFSGHVPTVWLQEHLYDATQVQWWDVMVALVYFTHFVVPWTIAAIFYFVSRPIWIRYIRRVLLLSYLGLLTYILLPAAPPWYAADSGVISGEVARISTRGWWELGLSFADVWLDEAQGTSNAVAALPSLHAAFSLLSVVALWPLVGRLRRLRWGSVPAGAVLAAFLWTVLALFPVAMGFSLVYGGEHYVADVLAGWLYVVVVCLLARWWEHRSATGVPPVERPAVHREETYA